MVGEVAAWSHLSQTRDSTCSNRERESAPPKPTLATFATPTIQQPRRPGLRRRLFGQ
jgi:hypothetical protein